MPDFIGYHSFDKGDSNGYRLREKTLYCSVRCAKKDEAHDVHPLNPEDYSSEEYGALCPVCEKEYENH